MSGSVRVWLRADGICAPRRFHSFHPGSRVTSWFWIQPRLVHCWIPRVQPSWVLDGLTFSVIDGSRLDLRRSQTAAPRGSSGFAVQVGFWFVGAWVDGCPSRVALDRCCPCSTALPGIARLTWVEGLNRMDSGLPPPPRAPLPQPPGNSFHYSPTLPRARKKFRRGLFISYNR